MALFSDPSATIDDLREAVTTLEDVGRMARRVFGGAHPLTVGIEECAPRCAAREAMREVTAMTPGDGARQGRFDREGAAAIYVSRVGGRRLVAHARTEMGAELARLTRAVAFSFFSLWQAASSTA